MNDKLRFRAWIKSLYELKVITNIDFMLKEIEVVLDVDIESGIIKSAKYDFNDIEIMQCTGLKDKNGVLIFEDDIVQYEDYGEMMTDCVTMNHFPSCWLEHESFGYEGENLITPGCTVVIGNKYENPELLK